MIFLKDSRKGLNFDLHEILTLTKASWPTPKKTSLRKKVLGLRHVIDPSNTMCQCLIVSWIEISTIETKLWSPTNPCFQGCGKSQFHVDRCWPYFTLREVKWILFFSKKTSMRKNVWGLRDVFGPSDSKDENFERWWIELGAIGTENGTPYKMGLTWYF